MKFLRRKQQLGKRSLPYSKEKEEQVQYWYDEWPYHPRHRRELGEPFLG